MCISRRGIWPMDRDKFRILNIKLTLNSLQKAFWISHCITHKYVPKKSFIGNTMFIIATWIDALLQQYNVFFSLEGEQPVVCGSLNSGGYVHSSTMSSGILPSLMKLEMPAGWENSVSLHPTSLGKWKRLGSLIILYGFINQIQAQKRQGHLIKVAFIFQTD